MYAFTPQDLRFALCIKIRLGRIKMRVGAAFSFAARLFAAKAW
jgi:hypothetical protein